jgi:regulatory protein
MAFGQLSLKGRALKLLAAREHSRRELERKLARHEAEPGQLKTALDELQARGFIDEQRGVDSLLYRRSARLGAARIRQELQAKGLDAERIALAVASLQASEVERAREVWRRKFGVLPTDAQQRARQARFLLARGFTGEAVRRVLAWDPDDEPGA